MSFRGLRQSHLHFSLSLSLISTCAPPLSVLHFSRNSRHTATALMVKLLSSYCRNTSIYLNHCRCSADMQLPRLSSHHCHCYSCCCFLLWHIAISETLSSHHVAAGPSWGNCMHAGLRDVANHSCTWFARSRAFSVFVERNVAGNRK